jgi:ABC-2 type transport system ATP-binding protein
MTMTLENVTVAFRKTAALSAVSTSLQDGLIYGLIGRNGAGKTTLLSLLASYRRPDNGVVRIDGDDPFENAQLMRSVHFVFPRDVSDESDSVRTTLEHCARYRLDFDLDWAFVLAERFRLDLSKSLSELSLGLQSAVNAIEGLASGAALTMFDEVHHGMDPHSRTLFYEALLDRREQTGRTFILSTHLVSEMAYLFDHVLILDEGRLIVDEPCDIVSERGTTVIGPLPEVEAFTRERRVIDRKALGGTASFMLDGSLTDRDREQAQQAGLEIAPVSLQDLFIHLTAQEHT